MNNLCEASLELGFSKDYFHVMKHENPDKFNYISSLSNNIIEAYSMYNSEQEVVKQRATKMYYLLREKKDISFMQQNFTAITPTKKAMYDLFSRLFNTEPGFKRHSTFIKFKKLIKQYNKIYTDQV